VQVFNMPGALLTMSCARSNMEDFNIQCPRHVHHFIGSCIHVMSIVMG
jgi:hypothetical protein